MSPGESLERLRGQKVLVTGAAGFIGGQLCERLARAEINVHAVSRSFSPGVHGSLKRERVDLSEPEATRRLLRRTQPDLVFHLAGFANGARDPALIAPNLQGNLLTTIHLLTAALECGAPLVVLPASLEEPDAADDAPSSPYAAAKWAASAYGRMFHQLYGLPVSIARIFITYGPAGNNLHKLIPYSILSLLDGVAPRLSSGRRGVDWIHVDDVVDGLLALAAARGAAGATLDIGSGLLTSVRSVVERIARLVDPARTLTPIFDAALDRPQEQVRVASVRRTEELTGWKARIPLDEGLARTVEWYRRNRASLRRCAPQPRSAVLPFVQLEHAGGH